ncbi:MAG TPA: mobilization protein, partial [Cyanobacteria bacterium UBA11369]|nr:mobilization protein [Cyanobacteria bacterium UBA11371]HBE31266.1 mobilization protein [Cyanobacteria bacterium UBA11368]HBE53619.1 mobilization protein [Cyanobacteria bacterium UBA11369]
MKLKPLPRTKHQTKLSNHIHIRLTNSDYQQIQMLAEEVNLSMSEFVRRGVTRRAIPRQLAAFDLKAHSCQVKK